MNTINITAVTPETVCIHGQTLAREYAETVLLGLLIASEGENHAGIVKVAEAFTGAGLSLEAHPKASRLYAGHVHEKQREKERLEAEARAHAERCREPSRQEIAEYHAEKARRAREIREHGARLRAARGR
ncbi:hypothetical protein [Stutzerimonas nitrititolerans]|uniref:Uncharacterized protein n=1 Tax=Stutzerimonas nitrititolerans TaxID=2482751 RepID=A0ABX9UVX3_9GAMM|nr:hypothetical protein [Stutzerimonas nitrititolerans]RMH97543.1 hypothetical protein EA795_18705 [Stutzerimonas nitrititolerans]